MRHAAGIALALLTTAGCGSSPSTAPSASPLPVVLQTEHYEFHAASADQVDGSWQETYHRWAIERLGVHPGRKIGYFRYQSRQDMGSHTGNYYTNGYADVPRFEVHTLSNTDNHEVVHLLVSLVGDAPALFSEGIAVAFETDPAKGIFDSYFNGEEVHHAARRYLSAGQLVLPLDGIIATAGFRAISDQELAYREAGSFVRFLTDTDGLDRVLAFFRVGSYSDSAEAAQAKFVTAFGRSLKDAETAWLAMLRAGT